MLGIVLFVKEFFVTHIWRHVHTRDGGIHLLTLSASTRNMKTGFHNEVGDSGKLIGVLFKSWRVGETTEKKLIENLKLTSSACM